MTAGAPVLSSIIACGVVSVHPTEAEGSHHLVNCPLERQHINLIITGVFNGIDVSISSVRKDGIINLAGIGRTGRQIIKREPSVTLREKVEVLRTLR